MATWYGEPYPGFFEDQQIPSSFVEQFVDINPKWIVGHKTECDFAKLNCEVLTIIHEEKRFPTKEELEGIRLDSLPPIEFTWKELTDILEPQDCWGVVDCPSVTYEAKYEVTFTEPEHPWNGISYEDFIQNNPSESALASAKGLNKHTLNHRLL